MADTTSPNPPTPLGHFARTAIAACAALIGLTAHGCAAEPGASSSTASADAVAAAPTDSSGEVAVNPDGGNAVAGSGDGGSDTETVTDTAGTDTLADKETAHSTGAADSAGSPDSAPEATVEDSGPPTSDIGADVGPVCTPTVPPSEVCDGVDNDCDGKTDQPAAGAKGLCDDGDACTVDACDNAGGKCTFLKGIVCNDGNPCTDDGCAKATGCTKVVNSAPCDDGNVCTDNDICGGGFCKVGKAKTCDDGNACTYDACAPKTGCASVPCTGPKCSVYCNDGDACTVTDYCTGGTCTPGVAKCTDNNPCTTDGCTPADGTCLAPVAIAGCKTCAKASFCNDNNDCTTEACAGGACVWTPIAGCIQTDFAVLSFVPKAPKIQLPSPDDSFTFVIENLGKPPIAGMDKLSWAIVASQDAVVDVADVKLAGATWPTVNPFAPGVTQGSFVAKLGLPFFNQAAPLVLAAVLNAKFICVGLSGGGDFAVANNNALCVANPFVPQELKAVSVTVPGGKLTAAALIEGISVEAINQGSEAGHLSAKFFLSKDNKLDSTDLAVEDGNVWGLSKWGGVTADKPLTFAVDPSPTTPHSFAAGPGFFCALVSPDLVAFEATPEDNVACTAVTVSNPADLKLNPAHIRFRTKAGVLTDTPTYGTEHGCMFTEVQNALYGEAKNVAARCFLHPTGIASAVWPGEDSWKVEWKLTDPVPAKATLTSANGVLKGTFGLTTALVLPKAPLQNGATYVCATLNHDGSVDEVPGFAGNFGCRKINVLGPDLIVGTSESKIGFIKYYDPQPTSLTRGVAYAVQMQACNQGNVTLAGLTKLKTRILLSIDKDASADDYVIHAETGVGFPEFKPMGVFPAGCGLLFNGKSATLPTSLAVGAYHLIFDINHDGAYLEPSGNNIYTAAITVK